jgi:hypothetical protein
MTIGEEANLSGVRWPLSPTSPCPNFFFFFFFFKKKYLQIYRKLKRNEISL